MGKLDNGTVGKVRVKQTDTLVIVTEG